ncbi:uncharacterized protein [Porites lutea]|uniref:uncharacterized protein n=1 Tax=Porites lutea TaxID=51062 RepID=UPI003CC50208
MKTTSLNLGGVVLAQPGVQLQGTSQARPNLDGVVLAQPGVPLQGNSQALPNFGGVVLAQSGVPLHTAPPTGQQSVQVSTTSYTNRPVVVAPAPPSNWMALSIFSVIFCTLPLGIVAFVFSYLVNESLKRGDHQEAVRNSNAAMWLNVLAIITGLPLWIFIFYAVY